MYDNFPESQSQAPQDVLASPQADAIKDADLRIIKPTDLREYEDWANDEQVCQRFLAGRPSTWRVAVQSYWRDRVSRRHLAAELGQGLETTKNLLRAIRKAAKDSQSGKPKRKLTIETQWPPRPHTEINVGDIFSICDGDPNAIAHAEEYHRLSITNQLLMFDAEIAAKLVEVLRHSDAIGQTQNKAITLGLLAKVDELKGSVAKADPFEGRAMFQSFTNQRTDYGDGRGRPRKQPATE